MKGDKRTGAFLAVGLACLLSATSGSARAAGLASTAATEACTAAEAWSFSGEIPLEAREGFQATLAGRISPARGFSDALALRKATGNVETKMFSEYWISRSLLSAGLVHAARSGFAQIASNPMTAKTAGVGLAALECLNRSTESFTSTELPENVGKRLSGFMTHADTPAKKRIVWNAASRRARQQIAGGASDSEIRSTLSLLKGAGADESFALGLAAAGRGDHTKTIQELERYLTENPGSQYRNETRLLLARAYYARGRFDDAISNLKKVEKNSNELAHALSELGWSALLAERYGEAIGAAINLQSGNLRRTFAPEGPMVMAMAMNELCQYPESLKAMGTFRQAYQRDYFWLSQWDQKGAPSDALYPLAVSFLKRERSSEVPERLGSEWLRSSVFIASQEELNLLLDEKKAASKMSKGGSREQKALGREIIATAASLKERIRTERGKMKKHTPGLDALSASLKSDMAALREKIAVYRRMRQGGPAWRMVLSSHERTASARKRELVAAVNRDLAARSERMLTQLQEIAENNQLIEVEIYNGAAQDIVWQNAHPDYKAAALKMQKEQNKVVAAKTWDWGKAPSTSEAFSEIWEDELGSFKAKLFDNCSSKERYLSLKSSGRMTRGG